MAHPARADMVSDLVRWLPGAPVVWDVDKPPTSRPERRWAVGRRAWSAFDPDADWHMVVQDDAVVCEDFVAGVERALGQLGPNGLVCPYTGRAKSTQGSYRAECDRAQEAGESWVSVRSLLWGVAIAAPVYTIPDMLEWCDKPMNRKKNYDLRVGLYYRDVLKWRTWYFMPSLVEHRQTPSLVGHDYKREAHSFTGESALKVDWSRTPRGEMLTPEIGVKKNGR